MARSTVDMVWHRRQILIQASRYPGSPEKPVEMAHVMMLPWDSVWTCSGHVQLRGDPGRPRTCWSEYVSQLEALAVSQEFRDEIDLEDGQKAKVSAEDAKLTFCQLLVFNRNMFSVLTQ
ncbi:unnamed protein product [Pleuronectes platessa]|uniref:Uncharacterized protein n=1 Tax=Pleuronectes platessa TaxID=8262 RepID=A0A9N7U1Q8_PLEPL|nr:unnamed protein product [Pleuronectes platessa]